MVFYISAAMFDQLHLSSPYFLNPPTPTNLTVRFEWTAYLTGLSTGRYNRRMRWVHSLPSDRRCCLLPGSIPLCYSINHAERRKTVSDYNSHEKKFNDWDDESIQFKIISKWIQKMIFFLQCCSVLIQRLFKIISQVHLSHFSMYVYWICSALVCMIGGIFYFILQAVMYVVQLIAIRLN